MNGGTGNGYAINSIEQSFQKTVPVSAVKINFYEDECPSPDALVLT
jgi:hypothetical protein